MESYTAIPYDERVPRPKNPIERPAYQVGPAASSRALPPTHRSLSALHLHSSSIRVETRVRHRRFISCPLAPSHPDLATSSLVSDVFSLWALKTTIEMLPRVVKDHQGDEDARRHMLLASSVGPVPLLALHLRARPLTTFSFDHSVCWHRFRQRRFVASSSTAPHARPLTPTHVYPSQESISATPHRTRSLLRIRPVPSTFRRATRPLGTQSCAVSCLTSALALTSSLSFPLSLPSLLLFLLHFRSLTVSPLP